MVNSAFMLHFFRKIRRDLLANNKSLRYLKYGIGEIILVVIGILIAIQVDNWNDERIDAEKTKRLFQEANDELVQNIRNVDLVIEKSIWKDSLYFDVLTNKIEDEDYKDRPWLTDLSFNYWLVDLVDLDFIELLEGNGNLSEAQDSILTELKDLYGYYKQEFDNQDQIINDIQLNYNNKLLEEDLWVSKYLTRGAISDEMVHFILNDPYYLNHLTLLRRWEIEQLSDIVLFRRNALNIYVRIADILESEKDTSLVKYFKNLEQIKGVYKFGEEVRVHIKGDNELKMDVFLNSEKINEFDVQPYFDSHLSITKSKINRSFLLKIISGKNKEVIGLIPLGDLTEENGNRAMWEKIE